MSGVIFVVLPWEKKSLVSQKFLHDLGALQLAKANCFLKGATAQQGVRTVVSGIVKNAIQP